MKHIDIINKIMKTEMEARQETEVAKDELNRLDAVLAEEYALMRAGYLARAERRIRSVEETEAKYADEVTARLDVELNDAIRASEESAAKNSEKWAEQLFRKVIEVPKPEN